MLVKDVEDCFLQRWQVNLYYVPHFVQINFKIVVNQLVSHAGNITPGNGGILFRKFRRQTLDGLANDFQLSHDGTLLFLVAEEVVFGHVPGKGFNVANAITNMPDKDKWIFVHRILTSSCKIRSLR